MAYRGVRDDRERWREGLDRMGLDMVRERLRDRPNRPREEAFPDLFPDPPYPSCGFVRDWVLEQENRIFRLSKTGIMIILSAVAVLLFAWFASSSIQSAMPPMPESPAPVFQIQQQEPPP